MALARDRILLTADVVTAASTNYAPITGLNFAAQLGYKYHIYGFVCYTVAATTTGARIGFSASPTTAATLAAFDVWGADGVGSIDGGGYTGLVTTASTTGGITALANSADTAGNTQRIEGLYVPAATQVLQLEIGPEAAAAVTVKAGSFIEWEIVG